MRIIGWMLVLSLNVHAAEFKGAIALVPGTFNAATLGHYFSKTIIETLESQNFAVHVVEGLSSTGEFEPNGAVALQSIRGWYQSKFPKGDVPLTLIGHSAGGFASLYAATLGRDLPLKNIILYSTPLEGSLLAENIIPDVFKYFDSGIFDLRGLPQLKPENVRKFLDNIRIDPSVKLYAVGSSQSHPGFFDNRLDSKYLSIALSLSGHLIGQESDGIIEKSSAYALSTQILSVNGDVMNIERLEHLHGKLEHPEQVLDYKVFLAGATMNIRFIDNEQKRMFTELGRIIESESD